MEPPDIARKLFSKGVLNEQMFKDITDQYTHETKTERLHRMMNDVKSAVKHEESAFVTFVQVMEELNTIEVNKLVRELKHEYYQQGTHNFNYHFNIYVLYFIDY